MKKLDINNNRLLCISLISILLIAVIAPQQVSAPLVVDDIIVITFIYGSSLITASVLKSQLPILFSKIYIPPPSAIEKKFDKIYVKLMFYNDPEQTAKRIKEAQDKANDINESAYYTFNIIKEVMDKNQARINEIQYFYNSNNLDDPIYLYKHGERFLVGKFIFSRIETSTQGNMKIEELVWKKTLSDSETESRTPLRISYNYEQKSVTSISISSLSFKSGWNQVSSPIASGIDISTIEGSCSVQQYKNKKLWGWDAQAQLWTNPDRIDPLKGYWIYVADACNVPMSGTPATFTTLQLYNGWNKVSAKGSISSIAGTCSGHIVGNWIWNWDKSTEKWTHPDSMELNKGYWVKVDQDCKLGG